MDDFNNFFDDQRSPQPEHTPVYHTPSPKNSNKLGPVGIICIVLAAVMCIVVLVNVIVLAGLKDEIAAQYAASISQSMQEQYRNAIDDALSGTNIVEDVTEAATDSALNALTSSVGQVANNCASSVARLHMAESGSDFNGLASGFLISDTDEGCTTARYILTNAHCVRYEKKNSSSFGGFGWGYRPSQTTYEWATYSAIICQFDGEEVYYLLNVVAYGSYTGDYIKAETFSDGATQPDIAILKIVGEYDINTSKQTSTKQPSNDAHPSFKIVNGDSAFKRGDAVALVGNPEGFGDTNSITTGCICQKDVTIESWGKGTFILTDAAVNGGNSGGPMLNIEGKVVGIVESKLVDESIDNMGFALSAQTILDFIKWASEADNNTTGSNLSITLR